MTDQDPPDIPASTPGEFVAALARARALVVLRDPDDPELLAALETAASVVAGLGGVRVRVGDGGLEVPGEEYFPRGTEVRELEAALRRAGLRELRVSVGVGGAALAGFLRALEGEDGVRESLEAAAVESGGTLAFAFERTGSTGRGLAGSIDALFEGWRPPEADAEGADPLAMDSPEVEEALSPEAFRVAVEGGGGAAAEEPEADAAPEPDAPSESEPLRAEPEPEPPPEPEAAPPPDPTLRRSDDDFLEGIRRLLAAAQDERWRLSRELEGEAEALRREGAWDALADAVEMLVLAEEEEGEDPAISGLVHDFTSPGVASRMVGRLGAAREEEERGRLIRVVSRLGQEGAAALADALSEARDRFQRRSFLDALVALGEAGRRVAEEMLEDPRWFVVRNGVAALGELGGEETVAQLTSALAHEDARVRREAVLALAKIGGEDAELLIVGMLEDPDVDVRAMACRGVGALKAERALKRLLQMLEAGEPEGVEVEALLALGQLGDPGAVPLIEKRATGGLFSRPSRDLRIAAYRALANIGTPHARKLLEAAREDRDAEVRAAVRAILESR